MADEITATDIATAALEPLEIEGDQGRVRQRSIDELLKAQQAADTATALANDQSGWGALRPARVIPPGSTD